MAFTPETKNPGDLVKSKDWNEAMQAIVGLFAKFDPAAGHHHSGASEDAPPITQNGIADNAIVTGKIQDGAITEAKLQDNAVAGGKIQDGSVTNSKIQDGAVTLEKLAAGVVSSNIGIAVTASLTNGATIPVPSGFTAQECVFFTFPKAIQDVNVRRFNLTVNATGTVTITYNDQNGNAIPDPDPGAPFRIFPMYATGVALAKRGGW
jgi:hypothetical protein